ncbi:hypothetical protein BKA62DRAFT_380623 [Auriculariales sp. MPI-PUGE-AT-0066]|nr:hypothetical protein BKA62DRAFT_380623 [Auriculariales sp. MPI-PUGE-AT-0066]
MNSEFFYDSRGGYPSANAASTSSSGPRGSPPSSNSHAHALSFAQVRNAPFVNPSTLPPPMPLSVPGAASSIFHCQQQQPNSHLHASTVSYASSSIFSPSTGFDASSYHPNAALFSQPSHPVIPARQETPSSPTVSEASQVLRVPPLHRGEACLRCRKRKIRCDAAKPACATCARSKHTCKYEASPYLAHIQELEVETAQLRARVAELEGRSPTGSTTHHLSSHAPSGLGITTQRSGQSGASTGYAASGQHLVIW